MHITSQTEIPIDEKYESQRVQLLAEAASKPLRYLHQFDCFLHSKPDCVMRPDEDGDSLIYGPRKELRNTGYDVIRVQIPDGVRSADAARALKKIVGWIEEAPEMTPSPRAIEIPDFHRLENCAELSLEAAAKLVKEDRARQVLSGEPRLVRQADRDGVPF